MHCYKANCVRDNLKLIREFVTTVLRELALSDVEINQLVLAVDEICSNLIIHSHKCNPNSYIEIIILNQVNEVIFEIRDRNDQPFDFSKYKKPSLKKIVKEKRKGGIGLMLVNKIMDKVEVTNDNSMNVWRMSKLLSPQ